MGQITVKTESTTHFGGISASHTPDYMVCIECNGTTITLSYKDALQLSEDLADAADNLMEAYNVAQGEGK